MVMNGSSRGSGCSAEPVAACLQRSCVARDGGLTRSRMSSRVWPTSAHDRGRIWENQNAGTNGAATGTRASANTSGPDFTLGPRPREIAKLQGDPHRTKKNLFLLPDRFLKERALSKNTIQPFDLMSRRHPLSSTRAARLDLKIKSTEGSRDVPASSRRQSSSQSSSLRSSPSLPS
jgi:hypothetical protein